MTAPELTAIVQALTKAIAADEAATVRALPVAGTEQTLCLYSRVGTGRLLGRDGMTFKSLCRVVSAASWRTGFTFRLILNDPLTNGDSANSGNRTGP